MGTVASVPRLLVLSYFEPRHLPRLLAAARDAGLPPAAPVYVGSYGVAAGIGSRIQKAGYSYAPMFQLRPDWYWERRRLPRDEEKTLFAHSTRSRRLGGPLPALPQLLRLSSATRVNWGVELGARFRDQLRAAAGAGTKTEGWQLDELLAETVGPQGRAHRELARGVLRGLVFGRPALGDRPQQGLVWWAHTAFVLAGRPITPELNAFWRILNRAAFGLIGEEYPEFVGDPAVAARSESAGQRALERGGARSEGLGTQVRRRHDTGLAARTGPGRQHARALAHGGEPLARALRGGPESPRSGRLRRVQLPLREQPGAGDAGRLENDGAGARLGQAWENQGFTHVNGACRDRTGDLRLAKPTLSQLS